MTTYATGERTPDGDLVYSPTHPGDTSHHPAYIPPDVADALEGKYDKVHYATVGHTVTQRQLDAVARTQTTALTTGLLAKANESELELYRRLATTLYWNIGNSEGGYSMDGNVALTPFRHDVFDPGADQVRTGWGRTATFFVPIPMGMGLLAQISQKFAYSCHVGVLVSHVGADFDYDSTMANVLATNIDRVDRDAVNAALFDSILFPGWVNTQAWAMDFNDARLMPHAAGWFRVTYEEFDIQFT